MASVAAISSAPIIARAATTSIDVTAQFLNAITLANEVNMDFATVEFSAAPAGGDTATLGTNGTITYAGNFSGAGTGTAGEVEITGGTVGQTVEIFCDVSATLARTGGGTINADDIRVSFTAGAPGAGSACNGVAGAAATTRVLAGGGADVILFGGRLNGATAASFVAGSYSSANAGGNDIQVDVFYQ